MSNVINGVVAFLGLIGLAAMVINLITEQLDLHGGERDD